MNNVNVNNLSSLLEHELYQIFDHVEFFDQEKFDTVYNEFLLRGMKTSKLKQIENRFLLNEENVQHNQEVIIDEERMQNLTRLALNAKKSNKTDEAIIALLQKEGLDTNSSREVVANLEETTKTLVDNYDSKFLRGGVLFFVGLILTIGTYFVAEERGGGYYMFAWGAILFGGIDLVTGFWNKYHYRSIANKFEKKKD